MKRTPLTIAFITLLSLLSLEGAVASDTNTASADSSTSCAQGGVCQLGEIGPGGGMVFFVRTEENVNVWKATPNAEADLAFVVDGWKYLEVAPKTWSGGKSDPKLDWCSNTNVRAAWTKNLQGKDWYGKWVSGKAQTGFLAGTGFGNSEIISQNCTVGAATSARKYRGGNKSDWYLPRITELNQLAMFAGGKLSPKSACCINDFPKKQSAAFAGSKYAVSWGSPYWLASFAFGKLTNQWQGEDRMLLGSNGPSSTTPYVRPIRAF